MKIIVAGSRNILDKKLIDKELFNFQAVLTDDKSCDNLEIVSGCARGPDSIGLELAKEYGWKTKEFPADWDKHGKYAGFKRNIEMAEYSNALLAFWDFKSRGTRHMIEQAINRGLIVKVVRV